MIFSLLCYTVLIEGDLIVYDDPVTINGDLLVTGNLFATNRLTVTGHLIVVGKVVVLDLSVGADSSSTPFLYPPSRRIKAQHTSCVPGPFLFSETWEGDAILWCYMHLKELHLDGFKSFGKSVKLTFPTKITGIVGPNGSGKSNVTEAFRFVLGEQSMKTLRGKRGEDLIFNGGSSAARSNKARVMIVFDNTDRIFDGAFDEMTLSRMVFRDGSNEYAINGTQVRHRDIVELLAGANIGATGHHIISQGEADRILNASPEERKEMLEDGLGLKLLQYRRTEAEKKLTRARVHMAESDLLLREITPHLRNLKRQVDRYEKAKTVREDLETLYAEYLALEVRYIAVTKQECETRHDSLRAALKEKERLLVMEKKRSVSRDTNAFTDRIAELQKKLRDVRHMKDSVTRELGRAEGELHALRSLEEIAAPDTVSRDAITTLYADAEKRFHTTDISGYSSVITYILERLEALLVSASASVSDDRRDNLEREVLRIQKEVATLDSEEKTCTDGLKMAQAEQEQHIASSREAEQVLLTLMTKKNGIERELSDIRHGVTVLQEDELNLKRELEEATVLIGSAAGRYRDTTVSDLPEDRSRQKERRRVLERKKIELESMGADSGEAVYREYKEVSERVTFLHNEREDLLKSIRDCEAVIGELQKELNDRFGRGIQAVSDEFETFFRILFGGGKAGISVEKRVIKKDDGESETRVGVGIHLSLPRKKVHTLEQLSGGERTLVSTALLFAISQVTPPPFLILDETDAALDEANSRRYGDMIEALAEKSQLILVTHNRETMHRAGALYGVTMDSSGTSALLSVQFEEAVHVAK